MRPRTNIPPTPPASQHAFRSSSAPSPCRPPVQTRDALIAQAVAEADAGVRFHVVVEVLPGAGFVTHFLAAGAHGKQRGHRVAYCQEVAGPKAFPQRGDHAIKGAGRKIQLRPGNRGADSLSRNDVIQRPEHLSDGTANGGRIDTQHGLCRGVEIDDPVHGIQRNEPFGHAFHEVRAGDRHDVEERNFAMPTSRRPPATAKPIEGKSRPGKGFAGDR